VVLGKVLVGIVIAVGVGTSAFFPEGTAADIVVIPPILLGEEAAELVNKAWFHG
jgi:hypothetical protein